MNFKNLYKNSSIFLVTVVIGIIGISSPLSAFAQNEAIFGDDTVDQRAASIGCNNINIFQATNILDFDNTNTQTNTPPAAGVANTNEPVQRQTGTNNDLAATLNGQQLTPEEILNTLFGSNGYDERPIDRVVCVSINNNEDSIGEINQNVGQLED